MSESKSGHGRKSGRGRARPGPPPVRDKAAEYRRKRRTIRFGQALMALGVLVAVVHLLGHLGAFGGQPSGWQDIAVGYPSAALVFVVGAIAAGQ